jgi:hypothetical protein
VLLLLKYIPIVNSKTGVHNDEIEFTFSVARLFLNWRIFSTKVNPHSNNGDMALQGFSAFPGVPQ